jgi:hypothetical protein
MTWLFFPPVFSFFFLILSALFHNRAAAAAIPNVVWGMTIAAYVCMCALSLFFILRGENRFNYGISLLTQGLMLSVMSMQFGVTFMSWIGLVLFLAGLVTVFFYVTARRASLSPQTAVTSDSAGSSYKKLDGVFEKLSVAVCHTDNRGVITNATTCFCEAVGRNIESVAGKIITDLMPIEGEEVTLPSGKWWLTQEHDGARYYFLLKPTPDGKPQQAAPAENAQDEKFKSIYDKATGLYADGYRKIRGPEEVSRAQRYKRPLSGLLVAISFEPSSDAKLTREQAEILDVTFKSRVQAALRITDCGFLTSDGRIQILLPETPQAGAKTLLSRIVTMPQDIYDEEIRTAVNPRVKGGLFFYNGASRMEYGIFSAALEESFVKSRDSGEQTPPKNQAA